VNQVGFSLHDSITEFHTNTGQLFPVSPNTFFLNAEP